MTSLFTAIPGFESFLCILFAVALYCLYCYLVRPLDLIRRNGELGFSHDERRRHKNLSQLSARIHKLRQIGDIPPVYPNGWFCIALSSDVKNGQIKAIDFMGTKLTLFRSHSGSMHLTDSYCPHLGASFNIGGKCVRIPYASKETAIPQKAEVNVWTVAERNKHVYVWYHCDGCGPLWEIPRIEEIESGAWKYGGKTEHEIQCHIQEVPENGADVAHLNYLHRSGINYGNDITRIELNKDDPLIMHKWLASWDQMEGDEKHISVMRLDQVMSLKGWEIPFTRTYLKAYQIGPGIVHMHLDFGVFGSGVVLQHITPERPLFQRARFVMYGKTSAAFAKFFLLSEAKHFERDIFIWSSKKYVRSPLYIKDDGPISRHRRWYSQFYNGNSPRLENGKLINVKKDNCIDSEDLF
ncbi:rieske [2Fe-2S] domain-containing protein [Ditylenchus destructor]|uniref:cholesterol 7-desaturase n=1 Tax=Ditylenchus destructor TaxID=166010 RepID=A0AAD4MKS6_9BILA|nr:rieske [2Fe-2S] domain-containing protein [Ditylenchus destructor]